MRYGRPIIRLAAVCLLSATLVSNSEAGTLEGNNRISAGPPRIHYIIDCRMDPTADMLSGTETVRFSNSLQKPISRLAFDWAYDPGQNPEITIRGKQIATIGICGPEGRSDFSPDIHAVLFDLPKAVKPGEQVEIRLQFSRKLSNWGGDGKYILTSWYPRVWWGFATHDDYKVKLDVPSEYAVGASGRLDPRTGTYNVKGAVLFGVFLGKDYQAMEAMAGDVQIRCIHTPKGTRCAQLLLTTAADVIRFYEKRFGFYPHRGLTIIPGGDSPMGGWPIATALVGIHGQEQMDKASELHWKWITAHEIGHMYWGHHVMEKDSPDWLWIGLGIYADREYVRFRKLGESKHRGLMDRYIEGVKQGVDTTVERPAEQLEDIKFDHNNIVVHGKGFSIISALCCVLGKETFERAYIRCLREYAGRRLGRGEFQAVCEEESGQDLGWFFDQWVRSNRCLSYKITSHECTRQDEKCRSTVAIKCLGTLKMPMPVEATFEDGSRQVKFTDRMLTEDVLHFESDSPLKQVRLDPNGELAMVVPPPTTSQQARIAIDQLPWTGVGDRALDVFKMAKEAALRNPSSWFKLALALYDGKNYDEAAAAFRSVCATSENTRGLLPFAALVWQGHILDIRGHREDALQSYQQALEADPGDWVRHDCYGIKIDRAWVEERLKIPFERRQ